MSLPNLDRGPCAGLARLLLGLVFLIASNSALADRFARITMNWSASTWSATSCVAGANTAAPPGAGDNVTICGGITVTQNVASPTINRLNVIGTLNAGANTITIDNTVGFTLSGTFNAGTSTVVFNNPANTTLTAGSAIQFYNLTINPAPGGTPRTYTFGAAAITINNNFLIDVQSAGGGVRAVTVEMGAGGITVTNNTTIQAGGNETANLDTNGFAFTSGRLIVGTSGTFTAAAATVTLNAISGILLTRTGTFTAGTSTVVMSPASGSLTLTTVVPAGGTITFNNLTIGMLAGQTGTLGSTITVGNNLAINSGTLADGGFQITGNGTGLLTAAANQGLTLGTAGAATTFPTLFTAGNTTLNATSTVTYASGVAQSVSTVQTYGNLTFSGASLKTTTPAGTMTIAGDWAIGGVGSSTNLTTNLTPVTMTGTTKQISGLVAGGITIPTLTVNGTCTNNATGTVIVSTALSGTGTLTQGANALLRINGTSGITNLTATASPNMVTYGGGAVQTVKSTTYHNLTINNASNVSLGGNTSVNGTLTFTSGYLFTTAANTLTMTAAALAIAGPPNAARHVVGNLARVFPALAGTSFIYTVGDGTNYTPVTITFPAAPASGSLTVSTSTALAADHPDTTGVSSSVDASKSVNRYFTLLKNSLSLLAGTYTATFEYISGNPVDLYAGATGTNFVVAQGTGCTGSGVSRTCSLWSRLTVSGTPTTTQVVVTGVSIVSGATEADVVIGEPLTARFSREKEFIYTRELY